MDAVVLYPPIGTSQDAPNENGSLHAKVSDIKQYTELYLNKQSVAASNTLRLSADTERSTTERDYVTLKTIQIYLPGTVRVAFEMKASVGDHHGAFAQVYVNDNLAKDFGLTFSSSYVSYTADINVGANDFIHLKIRANTYGNIAYCRNFRISYDISTATGGTILD